MNSNKGIMSAISLSRKAGKLVMGFDASKSSLQKGKSKVIMCASDLGDNTTKKVNRFCDECYATPLILPLTQYELLTICPKKTGVFSVEDIGFARLIRKQNSNYLEKLATEGETVPDETVKIDAANNEIDKTENEIISDNTADNQNPLNGGK